MWTGGRGRKGNRENKITRADGGDGAGRERGREREREKGERGRERD